MVAAEIRSQRAARDMKQEALAEAADINVATLSRMERGQRAIDLEQVDRIARALKMRTTDFIDSAIRHAEERAQKEEIYLPDGSLDLAIASTGIPSDEEFREVERHRKRSS
jgi:transcriptional regulator with XRE-family HTH domain